MKFDELNLAVQSATVTFQPYDRGASGSFVYRQQGNSLHAPRVIVSTVTNDASNDKYLVQLNTPRVSVVPEGCCDPVVILGTDLVKTELRFLANTSSDARGVAIDTQIALLQELRTAIMNREKVYA